MNTYTGKTCKSCKRSTRYSRTNKCVYCHMTKINKEKIMTKEGWPVVRIKEVDVYWELKLKNYKNN